MTAQLGITVSLLDTSHRRGCVRLGITAQAVLTTQLQQMALLAIYVLKESSAWKDQVLVSGHLWYISLLMPEILHNPYVFFSLQERTVPLALMVTAQDSQPRVTALFVMLDTTAQCQASLSPTRNASLATTAKSGLNMQILSMKPGDTFALRVTTAHKGHRSLWTVPKEPINHCLVSN